MNSCLLTGLSSVRLRAMEHRAYGLFTRLIGRDRRTHYRLRMGSYLLFRGEIEASIDWQYPVGSALPGSQIAERLATRPVSTGTMVFAMRGVGPLGIEDEADPPDVVTVELVDDVVQLPVPNPPVLFKAESYRGGKVAITCVVDNAAALVAAAKVTAYHNGGSGDVDWETPWGDSVAIGSGIARARLVRDPSVAHGTSVTVGLRASSAQDAEEQNTNTRTVVVDSEAPPAMSDLFAEVDCA